MLPHCYSYDMRKKLGDKGQHWQDSTHLNHRAHFVAAETPAVLVVKSIESRDEGLYRCRVDFIKSPTRNSLIQLTVIGKSVSLL